MAVVHGGALREDVSAQEIAGQLDQGGLEKLRFALREGLRALEVGTSSSEPAVVAIRAPLATARAQSQVWLQCDADVLTAIPVLALPATSDGLSLEAAHALVGLAIRSGGFQHAGLAGGRQVRSGAAADPVTAYAALTDRVETSRSSEPGERHLSWSLIKEEAGALPLCSSLRDSIWGVGGASEGDAVAWVTGAAPPEPRKPDPTWWERFNALTSSPHDSLAALQAHLGVQFDIPFAWTIVNCAQAHDGAFFLPPEANTVAKLIPEPERVVLAIDLQQTASLIADALLHLCGHLALGHVRPGDVWGHWDTPASLASTPHRQWDREVRAYLDANAARPARRATSLEECTPREKAWLVLLDHISKMVGQTRTLHEATGRYQAAAYQRQAAQRLVVQLDEYGGAMLCDGVGLGKTYVATTVVVHYANAWRDQLASSGRTASADPFRVTVLAPNSVVSTWQREALPPLTSHGVPLATIRVISHSKLSRVVPNSGILTRDRVRMSDMEHLLLSDLVVVDEAHNFRSAGARRSTVLRDLLRLQPRKDLRRRVLLLTATPVNNGLEDLRQQAALLFSKPLWLNDNLTPEKYRARAFKDVEDRVVRAAKSKGGEVAALLVHGSGEARFAYAADFRDDVQFGVQVARVGDYLKEQEKRLVAQQAVVREAIQSGQQTPTASVRIAGELLDRIVVQRSRALCKQIEKDQGSNVKLLFRSDAAAPEKLVYEDVYDDTRDVLARFLPLFETDEDYASSEVPPLSLKVYMWADVRDGIRAAVEVSAVVGLQRVLVLKRLESSPVAFLITLLRLLALHAHRLKQLLELCHELDDTQRGRALAEELDDLFGRVPAVDCEHIDLLLTGGKSKLPDQSLLDRWSQAHAGAKAAADSDDPPPPQFDLFGPDGAEETTERQAQLDRLWSLREDLTRDLTTLLRTAPGLADIVFGRFARTDWPQRFINGGQEVDWPTSPAWAMRIVTDGKLRRLVARLLRARAEGQKVIVFSQFTDTLAYVYSVLSAVGELTRREWTVVTELLGGDVGRQIEPDEVSSLVNHSAVVSGETEERDGIIHAFSPFYRLGPSRPCAPGVSTSEQQQLEDLWRTGWTQALLQPVDVLLATDVLAEGVNLQDAALLINFDVHWNPVRMIQRAGRIDRRLNPAIEEAIRFPDVEALASELRVPPPRYWWHANRSAAPATVNLLLPDELEVELQLRERIANKTLAIDFTLGLEQGTGAEADWMAEYRYHGISALNAWQGDRAIEQIAGYQQRLRRLMDEHGVEAEWLSAWNGWLREIGSSPDDRILAWARLGRKGGDSADYTRQLAPRVTNNVPHWLWTTAKPVDSLLNFWLALDGKTFPAGTRTDLGFTEEASRPIAAEDLLAASQRLVDEGVALEELGREVGRPIQQGAAAISAGFLGAEADRRAIQIKGFRLLQLSSRTHKTE
jgi:superfamily II DNA or RNA helicase